MVNNLIDSEQYAELLSITTQALSRFKLRIRVLVAVRIIFKMRTTFTTRG
jgi:hypothetical protein